MGVNKKINEYNTSDQELVKLAQSGDKEAVDKLLEKYDTLLTTICLNHMTKCCAYGIEFLEVKNIARIALFSFLRYYDADRSKFRTFVSLVVNQEVKKYILAYNYRQQEIKQWLFLDDHPFDDENDVTNDDFIAGENTSLSEWYEINEKFEQFNDIDEHYLSKTEKDALMLKAAGYKYSEIAEIIKNKDSVVDIAIKKLRKMKEM